MKKIYFLCMGVFAAQLINAQLTLTKAANEPVSGDIWSLSSCDTTVAVPKNTGNGQTWNFSTFSVLNNTSSTTYTNAASVPSSSLFPSANLAELKGGSNETGWHNTSGANWEFLGFYSSNGPTVTNFTNTGVLAVWPMSFGSGNSDSFSGTSTTGTTVSNWNGNVSYSVSGAGTVILPGNTSFTNCLQYVRTLSLTMVTGTVSESMIEYEYSYYSAGKKFPIVRTTYQSNFSGTVVTKSYQFDVDQSLVTGLKNEQLSQKYQVFPNPASDFIQVSSIVEKAEIIDMNGTLVANVVNANKMDVSNLNAGLYLIKIYSESGISVQKIIITR